MAFHISDGVLVKDTPNGPVRAMKVEVKLDAGEHWYEAIENEQGVKRLTAAAYDKLGAICGISFYTPETIIDNEGRRVGNPQIIYDRGAVTAVRTKVIALGRGPAGNWRCIELTFLYAVQLYLISQLYDRWINLKPKKGQGLVPNPKKWGVPVGEDNTVEHFKHSLRVPLSLPGSFLEIDMTDPEVMVIMKENQDRQQFCERAAKSMACRNAAKQLLGISNADDDGSVTVTVWDQADLNFEKVAKAIEDAKDGKVVIDGEVAEVQREIMSVDDKDIEIEREVKVDQGDEVEEEPEMTVAQGKVIVREWMKANCKSPYDQDPKAIKAFQAAGVSTAAGFAKVEDLSLVKAAIATFQS